MKVEWFARLPQEKIFRNGAHGEVELVDPRGLYNKVGAQLHDLFIFTSRPKTDEYLENSCAV